MKKKYSTWMFFARWALLNMFLKRWKLSLVTVSPYRTQRKINTNYAENVSAVAKNVGTKIYQCNWEKKDCSIDYILLY